MQDEEGISLSLGLLLRAQSNLHLVKKQKALCCNLFTITKHYLSLQKAIEVFFIYSPHIYQCLFPWVKSPGATYKAQSQKKKRKFIQGQ